MRCTLCQFLVLLEKPTLLLSSSLFSLCVLTITDNLLFAFVIGDVCLFLPSLDQISKTLFSYPIIWIGWYRFPDIDLSAVCKRCEIKLILVIPMLYFGTTLKMHHCLIVWNEVLKSVYSRL